MAGINTVFNTMEVFNKTFKYSIGDQLRHKGDTKSYVADLGLLVIARCIIEVKEEENSVTYKREYHCRLVRHSGSGDIASFKEHELITIEEYNKQLAEDEQERELMRNELHQTQREIYERFGINKNSHVHLTKDGESPNKKKYRACGFTCKHGEKPVLKLTSVIDDSNERGSVEVTDPSEIVVIQP